MLRLKPLCSTPLASRLGRKSGIVTASRPHVGRHVKFDRFLEADVDQALEMRTL